MINWWYLHILADFNLQVLLGIVAITSIALGVSQTFRIEASGSIEWLEGTCVVVSLIMVLVVQGITDTLRERSIGKVTGAMVSIREAIRANMAQRDENHCVKVIRGGRKRLIPVQSLVVGDVALIERGNAIHVDGILVRGHSIKCDESAATGESDAVAKVPAGSALGNTTPGSKFDPKHDPFILSGGKVLEGVGQYIVTAVGINSYHGRTLMSTVHE